MNQRTNSKGAMQESKLEQLLMQLWRTNEVVLRERLTLIQRAYLAIEAAALDRDTRIAARNAAHKLAGVLGTFALPRGTDLARQAELLLDSSHALNPQDALALGAIVRELDSLITGKSAEIG